jgi:hypothetical protein
VIEALSASEMVAQPGALDAFVERYADDPVLFASEICGIEFDEKQAEIARGVVEHPHVAVASAMGCGKSFVAALLAFWFLATRAWSKVVLTSAKFDQTVTILAPYLRRFVTQSAISEWFEVSERSAKWKGVKEAGFVMIWTWSASNPDSAKGQHADQMLVIADEASGIDDVILAKLYETLTGVENKMLLISNPSRVAGFFAECFSDPEWHCLHISNAESRWASKDTAVRIANRFGENSDDYRINVLGLFPLKSLRSIIGAEAIDSFVENPERPRRDDQQSILGLDVGAGGDWTVWALRTGTRFEILRKDKTQDLRDLVRVTAELVRQNPRVAVINVDSTGVGVFVPGELRRVVSCQVVSCNFGEASPEPDCANFRTWIYRRLGDALVEGECFLVGGDRALVKKSLALAEYELDKMNRKALVPKAKINASLGCSPDEADALALTCAVRGDIFASVFVEPRNDQAARKAFRAASAW